MFPTSESHVVASPRIPESLLPAGMKLSSPLRREITRLMAQQFWLFGYDIRRPEGNLLMTFGFDRCKAPPDSRLSTSRYTKSLATGETVTLWGFGLCWSDPQIGDISISRHHFRPVVREHREQPDDIWDPRDLQGFRKPKSDADTGRCQLLMMKVVAWMADYEAAVLAHAGAVYREQAIRAWKKPYGTAVELAGMWEQCGRDLSRAFAP